MSKTHRSEPVTPGGATAGGFGSIRAVVTMPVAWMVQGFAGALGRFSDAELLGRVADAHAIPRTAKLASIALFEASTWIDSLCAKIPELGSDPYVDAFRFVRARAHHHWAAAIYFDREQAAYVWYPESNLPLPREERFRDREGERRYAELFVGKPVRDVLARLEERVNALAPEG